jgi:uncharacterized membrane protein YkvA (DUF1232 family)
MPRYQDEYDDYDDWGDDERDYRDDYDAHARRPASLTQQALDWGISGSVFAILILTVVYVLSPLDLIPDVLPVVGQMDDIAAILAGSGSITFLAVLRYVLRSRVGRWGCLLVIILSAVGAFAIFWGLLWVFNSIL